MLKISNFLCASLFQAILKIWYKDMDKNKCTDMLQGTTQCYQAFPCLFAMQASLSVFLQIFLLFVEIIDPEAYIKQDKSCWVEPVGSFLYLFGHEKIVFTARL